MSLLVPIQCKEKFVNFDKTVQRLDNFYFGTSINILQYPALVSIVKLICILSHGHGAAERGFNII